MYFTDAEYRSVAGLQIEKVNDKMVIVDIEYLGRTLSDEPLLHAHVIGFAIIVNVPLFEFLSSFSLFQT
jgi:hypothetical protein